MGVYMLDVTDEATRRGNLQRLGARWWASFSDPLTAGPDRFRMRIVRVGGTADPYPYGQLAEAARNAPGASWEIGNEPNVPGQDGLAPEIYAVRYRNLYQQIKGADPTARVIAGNMLNWEFTCTACGGFTNGQSWFQRFWDSYVDLYGSAPPADAWGIHAYIVSWDRLPMVDTRLLTDQIAGYRDFLNQKGQAATPIWITELGVIWGYNGWTSIDYRFPTDPAYCTVVPDSWCLLAPCRVDSHVCVGARPSVYDTPALSAYLAEVLDWLLANAGPLRLQRWFWYIQAPVPEPYAAAFGGVALMETIGPTAKLTPFGQIFLQRATR
jgi:hypothetical protein